MKNQAQTLRFGAYIYVGIAVLFLVMKLFGLENISFLRLLNLGIVIHFTNKLARIYNMKIIEQDYFTSISSLMMANVVAVVLSVVSFLLYVKVFDPQFIHNFKGGILWSSKTTLGQACLSLLFEGMASSAIIAFIAMQYWKNETSFKRTSQRQSHTLK
jgi:hypothetical protein